MATDLLGTRLDCQSFWKFRARVSARSVELSLNQTLAAEPIDVPPIGAAKARRSEDCASKIGSAPVGLRKTS